MAKVKKGTGVTGVRNVRASKAKPAGKGRSAKAGGKGSRAKARVKAPKPKAAAKAANTRHTAGGRTGRTITTPAIRVAVRELDPQRKCGDGTSVQFLYRVDETVDGRATAHLVFFDRHGWYCEHGRTCPAVAHARKHNRQFARVS